MNKPATPSAGNTVEDKNWYPRISSRVYTCAMHMRANIRDTHTHAHTHCVPFHILKKFFNQILLEKITIQNKYLIINDKEWIIKQALAILSFPLIFLLHLIYLLCVHMCMPNKSHGMCVEVRGQFVIVRPLFSPYGFQGSIQDHRVWQQSPFSAEPSHGPLHLFLIYFAPEET